MLQARGYYQRTWTGAALGNLPLQIPGIAPGFPEIKDFYPATVNVRFEPKIIVAGCDHRTPPIRWEGGDQGEVFDFVRVRLVFEKLELRLRALMYVAHWSVHRNDPHKHEFLVEKFVDGLQEDMYVVMECDREWIELPYTASEPDSNAPRLAKTLVIF
jgi:hypothetical protein